MNATTAKIFVIEDDPGMRQSLCVVLEASGFTTQGYASAEEYLANDDSAARCIVLDLRMGPMSGLQLIQYLRGQHIEIPIIVVSGFGTVETAVSAMKLGAVEFFEKPVNPRDLIDGVKLAIANDEMRKSRETNLRAIHQRLATLSLRERELLGLLVEGKSSKQIALKLNRSVKTIENHRSSLLIKMRVQNVAALVALTVYANPSQLPPV
jgi:two-component system, LuxR family, response regulator FixJ